MTKQYMIIPTAMKKLLRIHGKVPLNNNEIENILEKFDGGNIASEYLDIYNFVKAIEKAHGIE